MKKAVYNVEIGPNNLIKVMYQMNWKIILQIMRFLVQISEF